MFSFRKPSKLAVTAYQALVSNVPPPLAAEAEMELESPQFRPAALEEFAARGFVRRNPYERSVDPPVPVTFLTIFGGLVVFAFVTLATLTGCPAAKTVSNDIAVVSAALCSEAAQQPNDPAWVALVCAVISDVNQVVQASPDGSYLAASPATAPAASTTVVIPRAQWEAIKTAAAASPAK